MSTDWKPRLSPTANLRALTLTPAEAFLLSLADGNTSLRDLGLITNQSAEQVNGVLARLVAEGAVLAPAAVPGAPEVDVASQEAPPAVDDAEPDETPAEDRETQASHLALYRQHFHHLPPDERASMAAVMSGAPLSALCFDPVPAVIRALVLNPHAGLEQGRLIAAHHQNSAGLEWLLNRPELMRDTQVQRLLFRNPQLNEGQLRRLVQSRRLLEIWKLSVSREATAQTRAATARLLRARFPTGAAEERVELIFTTEGRALAGLSGLSLDGKTVALLCARTYGSPLLVQNIARWSACPPVLIAHLIKQPLVMRQPRLRALLQQHPNAPAHVKGT